MAMDRERPRGGRKRRKVCTFCVDKVEHIDYKDSAKLRRFLSERSKILPMALWCVEDTVHHFGGRENECLKSM